MVGWREEGSKYTAAGSNTSIGRYVMTKEVLGKVEVPADVVTEDILAPGVSAVDHFGQLLSAGVLLIALKQEVDHLSCSCCVED